MSDGEDILQMATAHWASRTLYMMAKLGLADHLTSGAQSAEALAGPTGAHPPSLHRVMRALAGLGLLTEREPGRFALTPMGERLRSDRPDSLRGPVLTLAGEWMMRSWGELPYSIETGRPGFDRAFGMSPFDWLAQHPAEAAQFSETMVHFHGAEPAAVAAAYDFSPFETIVDVGGATGNLVTTILGRYPGPRGVLFDLPHVVTGAPPLIQARGLTGRVTIEKGSFFERVPAGGDAYLLSHVIHDWSEGQCLTILENCRRAMKPGGRILILEMVLPPGDGPHPGKLLDLMMLVGPGGQERTEPEYAALVEKAGLRIARVVPTASAVSVVETVAAQGPRPLAGAP